MTIYGIERNENDGMGLHLVCGFLRLPLICEDLSHTASYITHH